ncbi:structural maintenance of chromosome 1 [Pancytospora philotis]|nr:structural maintenance of chromosome 1 [Pancytospora philotis]
MQLEKIELRNFKSYRGDYAVGPLERFTSVIGPNGSGKSNFLDALIFAMNVSVDSLRVHSMGELISQGESECHVRVRLCGVLFEKALSLRGEEQQAVAAYRLDGRRVGAKEYVAKLDELNVVSRIKNFVVCQGDIIQTDVDLLQMVEHVCGSQALVAEYNVLERDVQQAGKELGVKYERRKHCLDRLHEVESGKEKMALFGDLMAEKEAIQRQVFALEIASKTDEIAAVGAALDKLKANNEDGIYKEKAERVNAVRAATVRLQKEYFEKESELVYLKSAGAAKAPGKSDGEASGLQELDAEIKKNEDAARSTAVRIFGQGVHALDALGGQANIYEERLLGIADAVAEKEGAFTEAVSAEESRLAELTLLNIDDITRRSQLSAGQKQTAARIGRLERDREVRKREREQRMAKVGALQREIAQLHSQISGREGQYEQILADESRKEEELNVIMREILMSNARESDAVRRGLVAKVVKSMKDIFSGVHGRVIDLIVPTQKKYELGVSALLASYDQAVVVDNERVALDCIKYLKEIRACKLSFIPLSRVSGAPDRREAMQRRIDELMGKQTGGKIVPARDCVQFDMKHSGVVDFVFKDSVVVDSSDVARAILYEKGYDGLVSTLGGVLFTPTGLVTGGKDAKNRFEGNMVEALLEKRTRVASDLKAVRDRKAAYSEIGVVKDRIDALEQQRSALVAMDNGANEEAENALVEQLHSDLAAAEAELRQLSAALSGFEAEKRRIRQFIKATEQTVFAELLRSVGLVTLEEYRSAREQLGELKTLLLRRESLRDERAAAERELALVEEMKARDGPAVDLKALESELDGLHRRLEESRGTLKRETEGLKALSTQRGEQSRSILSTELLRSRLEDELKDLKKYSLIECGGLDSGDGQKFLGLSVDDLNRKLLEVGKSIDQIDLSANVDDNGAQSRYAAANREYTAAKESAAALKKRFYEIKEQRMGAFSACFNAVSSEVALVYKRLTGGAEAAEGNAYIVYEGDPFQNNLRYYLMPPSKHFTEFHDLSGGERSMALLAFIFALNSFRQAPFYVFDEVDSALDRSNVNRLVNYLLETQQQFLVITLKQQVFQHSDALVGVYKCPRENVSRVLTYRLR